jgi:hypothetical protein
MLDALVEQVEGDGNCFMRCLSLIFRGNQHEHAQVRRKLCVLLEERIARGDATALFPLGCAYLLGEHDCATTVTPSDYVRRHLGKDAEYSEYQDVHLAQKLLFEPIGAKLVIIKQSGPKRRVMQTLPDHRLDAGSFLAVILCTDDRHYEVLDIANRRHSDNPGRGRLAHWFEIPRHVRESLKNFFSTY